MSKCEGLFIKKKFIRTMFKPCTPLSAVFKKRLSSLKNKLSLRILKELFFRIRNHYQIRKAEEHKDRTAGIVV